MSFNAFYDPETDKIHNAKPFSYSWFHEKRHQQQFRLVPGLRSINLWLHTLTYPLCSAFAFAMVVRLLPPTESLILMGASALPYSLVNLWLEVDAVLFGTINWAKHKL